VFSNPLVGFFGKGQVFFENGDLKETFFLLEISGGLPPTIFLRERFYFFFFDHLFTLMVKVVINRAINPYTYKTPPDEILNWINNVLDLDYARMDHLKNGAAFCQIIDVIFPRYGFCLFADLNFFL
jgi:hypothetical protein